MGKLLIFEILQNCTNQFLASKIGLQLSPHSLRDRRSWPVRCLNLALFLIYLYAEFFFRRYTFQSSGAYQRSKPLYNMAMQSYNFIFPLTYLPIMAYFHVKGSHITRLLDSVCFQPQAMTAKPTSIKSIVLGIILFDYCSFLVVFKDNLHFFASFSSWQVRFLMPINLYMIHVTPTVVFTLIHYYKNSTHQCLVALEQDLARGDAYKLIGNQI